MILHERSAERAAELIPPVLRLHRGRGLKEIPGVEVLVTKELEAVPVEGIRAGLGGQIYHAAVEPAELGGGTVALDLEFLNRVDDGEVRHLTGLGLQHGDAVEQVFVGARPPAVDARQLGIRGQRDSRCERREHDERPAVQGQLHDLLVLHDGAEAGRFRPKDWGIGGHRDLLADVTDGEVEVDSRLLARREADTLSPDGFEAGQIDVDPVRAWSEARRRVHTLSGRDDHALLIGLYVGDGDGDARHRGFHGIPHQTGDFTSRDLRAGRRRACSQARHSENRQSDPQTSDAHQASMKATSPSE